MRYFCNISIEGLPFYSIVAQNGNVVAMRVIDPAIGARICKLLEADDAKREKKVKAKGE